MFLGDNIYLYKTNSGNFGIRINYSGSYIYYSFSKDNIELDGEYLITRYNRVQCTINNVNITSKSVDGCYYGTIIDSLNSSTLGVNNFGAFVSVTVVDWSGATASFIPYYQNGSIKVMSDISQTISKLTIMLFYIES